MAEYVSKDALKQIAPEGVWEAIDNLKNADVVPVVRCKDCLHSKLNEIDNESYICKLSGHLFAPNFYCASGGRKDGGT